ncbi:MAG: hypothetical protein EON50_19855 [Acidovorax sp.]|nr:MAG: hypothetical protein EON50_19855 [Acidovorax sp.]
MPNDLTPDERRRLHQTAERLAVQLRREALQEFPALPCAGGFVCRSRPWLRRLAVFSKGCVIESIHPHPGADPWPGDVSSVGCLATQTD